MTGKHKAPIGVFDSGVGGLTVVQQLRRLLPSEDILYFGDTARAPYGGREPAEICLFMGQILQFMEEHGVKLAVVACNTMTAWGLADMQGRFPFPVIGMDSGVSQALQVSPGKRIGVIATAATVNSGKHERDALALCSDAHFFGQPCPEFVPLIEQERLASSELRKAAVSYLQPLRQAETEAVILGCTHYPVIGSLLQEILGEGVALIDPAEATAQAAKRFLQEQGMEAPQRQGSLRLYVSGEPLRAQRLAAMILQDAQVKIMHASMEKQEINRLEA